ncbi:hypothetical protein P280DRAFT_44758 [Massarina eburnea CBS 473.64]|uniref:Uncharacterized protein n=1 Tax=Massarina eburnea CBS 473.64 TaxID=1395130 RepID=A0A6A6RVV2_9PLEO|nr:hypothetical protein P280DRAFT_44758 [Massarina eburnea CBS 473.64]
MTVDYADSTIDHFDLKSFYYGCAVGSEVSVVGVPLACTVTVKGYADTQKTKLTASQSFGFEVGLLQVEAQMKKASLGKGFVGVRVVEFFVSNELVTAALIDTVEYTVYSAAKVVR